MPDTLQKITHRIHGQRRLLVPSIMMRRGYLETVHLGQIESELQAITSRGFQIDRIGKAMHNWVRELPARRYMSRTDLRNHEREIQDDVDALSAHMRPRMAHLQAMKKQITQFKLN